MLTLITHAFHLNGLPSLPKNRQYMSVRPSVGPSVKKRHADSRGHATYLVGWSFHRSVGPSIYRRTHISAFCHPNIDGILIPKSAGSVHAKFKFVNYKLAPPKAKLHEGVCSHWTKNCNYCHIIVIRPAKRGHVHAESNNLNWLLTSSSLSLSCI